MATTLLVLKTLRKLVSGTKSEWQGLRRPLIGTDLR